MENSTKRSILKIIKFTIALALICLLAFVGFKVGPYSRTAGNIIVSLAILLACGLLVTASHKSMQKNRGKLIVFAILYLAGVGIYDYLATLSGLLGILSPINNSLSVFFP